MISPVWLLGVLLMRSVSRCRERTRLALLQDHPPLEKRLARLAEMAREQGRAVGP